MYPFASATVPTITLSTRMTSPTSSQRPSTLPAKYDQRRERTVQKRTAPVLQLARRRASKPSSAMSSGPSQMVMFRK